MRPCNRVPSAQCLLPFAFFLYYSRLIPDLPKEFPSLTTLTDFSPEDLAVLNRTPTAVAMAAAYAEQDGALTLAREMRAGLTAAREAAFAFPDNEVIQLLAATMQDIDEDGDSDSDGDQPGDPEDAEEIVEERNPVRAQEISIDLARQSMAIVDATATLEEAVQFKHWLYAIADQVTLATRSGGFLGFGGKQVAEGEKEYLAGLRAALGLEA